VRADRTAPRQREGAASANASADLPPEQVKQANWWAWPGTAMLIVGEYDKYLGAVLRATFGVHLAESAP
jgi:hypothetical protein